MQKIKYSSSATLNNLPNYSNKVIVLCCFSPLVTSGCKNRCHWKSSITLSKQGCFHTDSPDRHPPPREPPEPASPADGGMRRDKPAVGLHQHTRLAKASRVTDGPSSGAGGGVGVGVGGLSGSGSGPLRHRWEGWCWVGVCVCVGAGGVYC